MGRKPKLYLYGLIILVILSLAALAVVATPSRASLGNHGVPVFGRLAGPLPQTEQAYLKLYAADGTLFGGGNETVPEGYYLLITDVVMTPDGGTDPAAVMSVDLLGSTSGGTQSLRLRSTDNGTLSLHFSTPYFILRPGDRLRASNAWFSDKWAFVNVSGLLVTNLAYLPVAINN